MALDDDLRSMAVPTWRICWTLANGRVKRRASLRDEGTMTTSSGGSRLRYLAYREGRETLARSRPAWAGRGERTLVRWRKCSGRSGRCSPDFDGPSRCHSWRPRSRACSVWPPRLRPGSPWTPSSASAGHARRWRGSATVPPQRLLTTIALVLIALALLNALISAAGRQLDDRVSQGLQARLRRRVFDHIIGLPIHRIRAHRAGGLAGLLRDDVASAAGLFSTMAYNPWRSLVQLIGTGLALIVVDWRILVLAVAVFPLLYVLHRRWIRRLRPLWRDIGLLRRHSDVDVTEAFIGLVIRSFGRRRTETRRYARDQHLLLRQDLLAAQLDLVVEIGWSLLVPVAVSPNS